MEKERKFVPEYDGILRSHRVNVPICIKECSGIVVFGRRLKSFVFSTDAAIIKNINADAVIAVYPFTPQPAITRAVLMAADMPVFVGVGGGTTTGSRAVRLGCDAEDQGAYGIVVNAPIPDKIVEDLSRHVEIPIVVTVASDKADIDARIRAGADIFNVSAAGQTIEVVASIRKRYPLLPIIATGGPTEDSIKRTIKAGANAITYTPPTTGELFSDLMRRHRAKLAEEEGQRG